MHITELTLHTSKIEEQRNYYEQMLGLPLLAADSDTFTVQAGETRLTFLATEASEIFYHFAFTIPRNKLAHAKEWLLARTPSVPLLSLGGQDEFYGESWNVSNLYFYDAAGNILEFIAHHDLANDRPGPFGPQDLLRVSEIGLAVNNVLTQVAAFKDRLGLEPYKGESSDTFTAVGDISGLFIVVKIGRFWFPTETDAAPVAPVEVMVEGAEEQRYQVSPYPYAIDVVAKTSRS